MPYKYVYCYIVDACKKYATLLTQNSKHLTIILIKELNEIKILSIEGPFCQAVKAPMPFNDRNVLKLTTIKQCLIGYDHVWAYLSPAQCGDLLKRHIVNNLLQQTSLSFRS